MSILIISEGKSDLSDLLMSCAPCALLSEKEAETADQYIEKFAHQHAKEYAITVATSDGLEQMIILGQG